LATSLNISVGVRSGSLLQRGWSEMIHYSPICFFEPSGIARVESAGASKMSAPLIVSIPHRLGREEAARRLKAGLTRAAASIPILQVDEERWEGDRLVFRVRALGQAASGHLDVAEDHARLEVMLPWLLQRFAKAAQVAIKNRGSLLLTKRG
jgi:hypothetical protein